MTPLTFALDLGRRGTLVLPCAGTETLVVPIEEATTDATIIRGWWRKWPAAIPATPTGAVTGLVVISVDPDHLAPAARVWYEAHRGVLSTTRACRTPRGFDYWFSLRATASPCRVQGLGGVSVYSDGAYAIHWPACGLWHQGSVQPLPPALLSLFTPRPPVAIPATPVAAAAPQPRTIPQLPVEQSAATEPVKAPARQVSGPYLGDRVADKTLRALRAAGSAGLTRTQISALLKRHQTAERIGTALEHLAQRGLAERHERGSNGGRPAEIWRIAGCEKSE